MKISELSDLTGVPPATVKFYVREGLLPSGERTSANQSNYDEAHVARLKLIRAFIEVGGLSVASAKAVLAAIDDDQLPFGYAIGIAAHALPHSIDSIGASGRGAEIVSKLVEKRGWLVGSDNAGLPLVARVLDDYAALGREDLMLTLDAYADIAETIAQTDLRAVADSADRAEQTETIVIGTVLGDALLAGLRRLTHENAARNLFPVPDQAQ